MQTVELGQLTQKNIYNKFKYRAMSLFYQSLGFTQFNHLINIHIHSGSSSLFYLLYFINFFY